MLIDHRTYRVKPGTVQAHLDIYEQYGFAAQTPHLGKPVAYMFAESGDLNTIVHIWAYEDAADRAKQRAAHAGRSGMADLSEEEQRGRLSGKPGDQADDPGEVRADRSHKADTRVAHHAQQ